MYDTMSPMKPVENTGYYTDPRKKPRDHRTSRIDHEKTISSRASHGLELRDKPRAENPLTYSYGGMDHESKQSVGVGPPIPPKHNHQKQRIERKGAKEGELVRHMSNLPGYLQRVERGENLQEKALNFGVLDWDRLEKWKYNQNLGPRNTAYPSSSSNTSSPFSTVGSSALSSKSDYGTQAHQTKQPPPLHAERIPSSKEKHSLSSKSDYGSQTHQRKQSPPLHADRMPSSKETHSQGVIPSKGNGKNIQDFKGIPVNSLVPQKKFPKTDQSLGTKNSEIKLDKGKGKFSDPDTISDIKTSSTYSRHDDVSFNSKGKTRARESESTNRTEQYNEFKLPDQLSAGRQKTIVLLLPKDFVGNSTSQQFVSKEIGDGRVKVANHETLSKSFRIHKEVQSNIPHSCPLPRFESREQPENNLVNSIDARRAKVPVHVSHALPCSAEMPTVQPKDKHVKGNSSTTKTTNQPGRKAADEAAVRGSSSPSSSAVGLSQMTRSFSSREVSSLPQLSSTFVSAKSGPVQSNFSSLDNSNKGKARSKSSPLKRLLDPLLKPKAVDRHQAVQDEAKLMRQIDSSSEDPVRNSSVSDSNPISTDGSYQDEKHEALLKVVFKDGLPYFTFAVDKNILTATMKKKSTSEKYDCSWIYTFYSFHKSKKKSGGWINQVSKGKSQDYVPKVVGELKVSGSKFPRSSKGKYMVREFLLFGVEQRPAGKASDQDSHPNNELAAIIVKVPKETTGKLSNDGEPSGEIGFSECLRDERCSCNFRGNLQSERKVGSQPLSSTTVLLPVGVHSMPATGVPSPLIDRWRSGGSCDCGGWDEGCNLRILASQDQCSKNSSLSTSFLSQVQFNLFVQGELAQESVPVFSLGAFKEGIFSVDYNASISTLQAFSICTAILHSRKLAELSEMSNLLGDKISHELIPTKNYSNKVPTGGLEVPFPPPSPVGRV